MTSLHGVALLALVACASRPADGPAGVRDVPLRFELQARADYRAGHPVVLRFALHNGSARRLWVLRWHTPLEGIRNDIFTVSRDGKPVEYRGPMVKRGAPERDDYVAVEGHGSVSAEVDLAEAYDLAVPGSYRVVFGGRLLDVAEDEAEFPRDGGRQHAVEIAGNAVTFVVGT